MKYTILISIIAIGIPIIYFMGIQGLTREEVLEKFKLKQGD